MVVKKIRIKTPLKKAPKYVDEHPPLMDRVYLNSLKKMGFTPIKPKTTNVKRLGFFGAKMPDSTKICPYCKHYHSRNLPGGWCESGCTKHGWKPDGLGGEGKRLGDSYSECKGKSFEYIQRQKRFKPIPKP